MAILEICELVYRDETRFILILAELDAYYARLYRLTHDELRYILDTKEVSDEDFPGVTSRVLKKKEVKQLGEYETRCHVQVAWDRMTGGE